MPARALTVELGRDSGRAAISALVCEHGAGGVDVRDQEVLRSAILDNRLFVVRDGENLVACATYFVRPEGVELGMLVVAPSAKRKGVASLLAKLRITHILVETDPPSPIFSETYPESLASLNYQASIGFRPLDRVPMQMHRAAWQANSERAVIYCVADPHSYPKLVSDVVNSVDAGYLVGSSGLVSLRLGAELRGLVGQARRIIASGEIEREVTRLACPTIHDWLASKCGTEVVKRSDFLKDQGIPHGSWGYSKPQIDTLAARFRRTRQVRKTAAQS